MKKLLIFVFIGLVSCNSNDEKVQESQTNLSELVSIEKNDIPGDTGFQSADYGLIFGYTVYLDYHIKAFKNA